MVHLGEISDDYLISLCFEKNQGAIDFLFERYTAFLYGIICELQKKEGKYVDFDELFQDAFLVFLNCIQKYDADQGCFYFFVRKSVIRRLEDKMRFMHKTSKISSLDVKMYNVSRENCIDYVAEECEYSYYDNTIYERLINRVDGKSGQIIDLKIAGYSYNEIAEIMGDNKQGVYRRVRRIKNILKDIIEKID